MNAKNIHTSELFDALKTVALSNSRKTKLEILNYGAAIFSLKFLQDDGEYLNVIVGPKDPEDYLSKTYKEHNKGFGASVGRYAGRISREKITLEGKEYPLSSKDGVHLHGGETGFMYKFWKIEEVTKHPNPSVRFSYLSEDGEEGYPGNLKVEVKYTLTEEDELIIEYTAETDQATVVNLTNHAYFNLNGGGSVENHLLQVNAGKVLEMDEQLLPTGGLLSLDGDEKDFRQEKEKAQLLLDNAFILDSEVATSATLVSPSSGIRMAVSTNQPALVVYAPEDLPSDWEYHTEISEKYPSICLEAQNFPDAPNQRHFPSAVLLPGERYLNRSLFNFSRGEL